MLIPVGAWGFTNISDVEPTNGYVVRWFTSAILESTWVARPCLARGEKVKANVGVAAGFFYASVGFLEADIQLNVVKQGL